MRPRPSPDPMPPNPKPTPEPSRARSYYELTKPGIAGFAMINAGVAFLVGAGGQAALIPVLHTLLGTLLATAGALALNQYQERDIDALMERTRDRPLPSGRLQPRDALLFGILLVVGGTAHLASTVGMLPAALTLGSALAYNFIYTPLKSRSYLATFAGAVPGAMPALIGWSAATGTLHPGAFALFGIAFLWQLPHVFALAWILREDYERAGFFLAPPTDALGTALGRQMTGYSLALLAVSTVPTFLGITGSIYLVGAVLLGAALVGSSLRASVDMSRSRVRTVFLWSLLYQPLLLGLLLFDLVRR